MYIQYFCAIKMSVMKSLLYSTPVVQYLLNHHPIVVSVFGMRKPNLNALHTSFKKLLQIKVLQKRNTPASTPNKKKLGELSKITLAD